MNKDEINRAIAEAVGTPAVTTECRNCHGCGECGGEQDAYFCPDCDGKGKCDPRYIGPDYAGCLNACHEMETSLTLDQQCAYNRRLKEVKTTGWVWNAKPEQRAEAFLRALGLWQSEPPTPEATRG